MLKFRFLRTCRLKISRVEAYFYPLRRKVYLSVVILMEMLFTCGFLRCFEVFNNLGENTGCFCHLRGFASCWRWRQRQYANKLFCSELLENILKISIWNATPGYFFSNLLLDGKFRVCWMIKSSSERLQELVATIKVFHVVFCVLCCWHVFYQHVLWNVQTGFKDYSS